MSTSTYRISSTDTELRDIAVATCLLEIAETLGGDATNYELNGGAVRREYARERCAIDMVNQRVQLIDVSLARGRAMIATGRGGGACVMLVACAGADEETLPVTRAQEIARGAALSWSRQAETDESGPR
jgi:hypothetical protein